jgi:hypothetical protein
VTTCAVHPYSGTAMGVACVLLLTGAVLLILAGGQDGRRALSTRIAGSVTLLVAALLLTGVLGS